VAPANKAEPLSRGQRVKAGDVLATLDPTFTEADRDEQTAKLPAAGAWGVVSGDFSIIAGARTVADEVNKLGRFDAVIHDADIGVGSRGTDGRSVAVPARLLFYFKQSDHLRQVVPANSPAAVRFLDLLAGRLQQVVWCACSGRT
jgi:hypothetical protein